MKGLHYIAKSISVLNCLLTVGIAAALYYIAAPLPPVEIRITAPASRKAVVKAVNLYPALPNPSFADYILVSEKNLFHPERKFPQDKLEVIEKPAIPKPDLILYGTLIAGDMSIAYIEDRRAPYATPGREKRQTQLKKGDSVSGYILREIEPNRIVLVQGDDKVEVTLDAQDKKREGNIAGALSASRMPDGSKPPLFAAPPAPPLMTLPSFPPPPPGYPTYPANTPNKIPRPDILRKLK